jgi:hypothetical protein
MRDEQSNVRQDDLRAIMQIMKDTGRLPLKDNGEEYAPFVLVAYNGEAWVSEGNHRIMAADALGWQDLPVELRYFDGGERVKSGPVYPGRIGLGAVNENFADGTENSGSTDFVELTQKFVTEVLNTRARGAKWTRSDEDMSTMEFTASNGIVYEIDFLAPYIGPDEIDPIDFIPDMSDDAIDQSVFVEFSQKDAAGDVKQGIAGTGAAAEVFGIVTNAILLFVKKRKPPMLYFQAAEPNRQKLYAAIINRLIKNMPGYTAKQLGDKFAIYSVSRIKKLTTENFADGKVKGKSRPGRVKRAGASCTGSVTDLRKRAKNASGERAKMYHWCANMKSGKKK